VSHLTFYRQKRDKKERLYFALATIVVLLATLPYALLFHIWSRPDLIASHDVPWPQRRFTLLIRSIEALTQGGFLSWFIVGGLALFLWRSKQTSHFADCSQTRIVNQWLIIIFSFIIILALVTAQPIIGSEMADLRYFIPILPFCAGVTGFFLWCIFQKSRLAALGLFLLLVSSNALMLDPVMNKSFRWLLPAYICEVHQPYPTSYSQTITYIKAHTKQDSVISTSPAYTNYPLMFYLGDKLRFGCLLNRQTALPDLTIRSLGAPLYKEENFPNYVILFSIHDEGIGLLSYLSRIHHEKNHWVSYPYILQKRLNIRSEQTQRPELPWHSFGPPKLNDPRFDSVYIFKRGDLKRTRAPLPERPSL
jgi:hypothetical protein